MGPKPCKDVRGDKNTMCLTCSISYFNSFYRLYFAYLTIIFHQADWYGPNETHKPVNEDIFCGLICTLTQNSDFRKFPNVFSNQLSDISIGVWGRLSMEIIFHKYRLYFINNCYCLFSISRMSHSVSLIFQSINSTLTFPKQVPRNQASLISCFHLLVHTLWVFWEDWGFFCSKSIQHPRHYVPRLQIWGDTQTPVWDAPGFGGTPLIAICSHFTPRTLSAKPVVCHTVFLTVRILHVTTGAQGMCGRPAWWGEAGSLLLPSLLFPNLIYRLNFLELYLKKMLCCLRNIWKLVSQSLLSPHRTRKHTGVCTLPRTDCVDRRAGGYSGNNTRSVFCHLGHLLMELGPFVTSCGLCLPEPPELLVLSSSARPAHGQRRAFPWNRRGQSPLLNLLSLG